MAALLELLITDVRPREIVAALGPATVGMQLPGAPSLWVVPVTNKLSMVTDCSDVVDGFELLTEGLVARAAAMSATGHVLYAHVEFHGGLGFHAVAGWFYGEQVLRPLFTANNDAERPHDGYTVVGEHERGNMAVNVGLRFLGASAGSAVDEFAAVGLDTYRWNDEWAAAAGPLE